MHYEFQSWCQNETNWVFVKVRDHVYCPSIQYKQSIEDKNSSDEMSSNSSVLIQTKMLSDYSNEMKGKIYYNLICTIYYRWKLHAK